MYNHVFKLYNSHSFWSLLLSWFWKQGPYPSHFCKPWAWHMGVLLSRLASTWKQSPGLAFIYFANNYNRCPLTSKSVKFIWLFWWSSFSCSRVLVHIFHLGNTRQGNKRWFVKIWEFYEWGKLIGSGRCIKNSWLLG